VSELAIAIPFFSGLEYLRSALGSLVAQSASTWHAVVVDDAGPEPESADVVRDLGDPRVTYVRNDTNLGLAKNWNACLERADGDLVTIFHADDELAPDYVDLVLRMHEQYPDAVAVHAGASVIGADGKPSFSFPDIVKRFTGPRHRGKVVTVGDDGLATLLRGQFIFCPSLSYKRSRLPRPTFDPRWRQVLDLDLLARLLFAGETIVGTTDRAYRYRRHGESQTMLLTASHDRFREELALYDEIARDAERVGWERSARVARRARIVRAHVLYRALGSVLRGAPKEARATMAVLKDAPTG
jgi:glycosyltransferase involved in cell wall biosynthesis